MAERLETGAVTSVEQTLIGGVPGVTMLTGNGMAGTGGQIRLRGSSSAALAGDPIIYVDGVRINSERGEVGRYTATSRLDDIDPADIESIEIIKGPAAATLYGTEASNGVIQVITKKGMSGAPQFDAAVELGSSWLPRDMIPTSWAPEPSRCSAAPCQPDDLVEIDLYQRELDRGNRLFDSALLQSYNLSVRGGTDLIQYFASANHNDQDGIVDWNWNTRSSGRISLSVLPTPALSIALNTSYAQSETAPVSNFWGSNFAWGGRPATALIDDHPDRGFSAAPELFQGDVRSNLVETNRSTWSAELRHQPAGWITHRLVGGLDLFRQKGTSLVYRNPLIEDRVTAAREGSKSVQTIEAPTITIDFSGTMNFSPTESLGSATSYGLQYYRKQDYITSASGTSFATPSLTTVGAAAVTTGGESFVENSTVGVYVQQQFDWKNRLFLTGAVRADDNSAFGANFDAAIYPKLSATWVVHDEPFWNVPFIDQLRLRGAWGAAGQQPDAFASTRLFRPISGRGGQPGLTPYTYGNEDLGPERGEELELGFDASVLDSRIDLAFTAFWRKTKDALVERPLAPSVGYTSQTLGSFQLTNAGLISSWGTETALGIRALTGGPLGWDVNLAFTTLGNRIDDLAGISRIPVQRGRAHEEGYPLASIIEYKVVSADFVDGVSGPVTNLMCDGGTGPDGKQMGGPPVPCDEAPRVFWGKGEPTWLLNVVSNWNLFENWQLSASIDAKGGHWMSSDYLGARHSSFPSSRLIFLQDDPIAMAYLQVARSGLTFHRGDFAKLREVTLRYTVPTSLAARIGARNASLQIGARNLATLWVADTHVEREKIIDPEMNRPDENFGGESGGDWPP
ncbi:MAG: TonB-dependent receptor plug domain-containing protein [Gemmatimonas sp.]|nr:TonB-dependent receptor plug domain-containing protein [Gemmatimonas sp.]